MTKAYAPENTRHVPLRSCAVCREKAPKQTLLRHVCRIEEEGTRVIVDEKQILPGRGVYVCRRKSCQERLPLVFRKRCRK